jgi:hypothetical protein
VNRVGLVRVVPLDSLEQLVLRVLWVQLDFQEKSDLLECKAQRVALDQRVQRAWLV